MKRTAPVVVTFEQVARILGREEALGGLEEVANTDRTITNAQRAAMMAGFGQVLDTLRHAEKQAGAKVLTTAHHAMASRLQSLLASGEGGTLELAPLATGGLEAVFDTSDWFGWASVAWEKLKHLRPHPLLRPKRPHPEPFPNSARVGIVGDWGTGLYGAPHIANSLRDDADGFTLLMHLGDVYYSGTEEEISERFLALWPRTPKTINRALNSNHEMYSGGNAYFGKTLPTFEQEASYFAFQNDHWTLVGLDVAYEDHAIDDEQADWISKIVLGAGHRRVIFFSHHQLFSNLESSQGAKLWSHPLLGSLLRSKRIFAWYWGHEHRCTIYLGPDHRFGLLGRCIGHGGMPQSRAATINLPRMNEPPFTDADWRMIANQSELPPAAVLEGRNVHIRGEEEKFSPHGYAVVELDGPRLIEEVRSAEGLLIYRRQLA